MKIAIGADHAGFELKERVKVLLLELLDSGFDDAHPELTPGIGTGRFSGKRPVHHDRSKLGLARVVAESADGVRAVLGFRICFVRTAMAHLEPARVCQLPAINDNSKSQPTHL